eukprot:366058-Chlamydomonas_euryale.AAC.4
MAWANSDVTQWWRKPPSPGDNRFNIVLFLAAGASGKKQGGEHAPGDACPHPDARVWHPPAYRPLHTEGHHNEGPCQ